MKTELKDIEKNKKADSKRLSSTARELANLLKRQGILLDSMSKLEGKITETLKRYQYQLYMNNIKESDKDEIQFEEAAIGKEKPVKSLYNHDYDKPTKKKTNAYKLMTFMQKQTKPMSVSEIHKQIRCIKKKTLVQYLYYYSCFDKVSEGKFVFQDNSKEEQHTRSKSLDQFNYYQPTNPKTKAYKLMVFMQKQTQPMSVSNVHKKMSHMSKRTIGQYLYYYNCFKSVGNGKFVFQPETKE